MKTGDNNEEENSPRISAIYDLSLRGPGPPAESGGLIGDKLWWRRWRTLGGLITQRRGDGAHKNGRQRRGGELPVQRRG